MFDTIENEYVEQMDCFSHDLPAIDLILPCRYLMGSHRLRHAEPMVVVTYFCHYRGSALPQRIS